MGNSSSYDGGDCGGSHGVSHEWVKKRVASGIKKATPERAGRFSGAMEAKNHNAVTQGTSGSSHASKRITAARAADPARGKGKNARSASFDKGYESGWDRWRAKKGHSYDEGGRHDDH